MSAPFPTPRAAALALLNGSAPLTVKQAQFLGGVTATEGGLTDKQLKWLVALLERGGLPPMAGGGQ